jgi:hypothetical protein
MTNKTAICLPYFLKENGRGWEGVDPVEEPMPRIAIHTQEIPLRLAKIPLPLYTDFIYNRSIPN